MESKPTLYVVATPIGNLDDITFRAVEILKQVSVIFAEDPRVTKRLLDRYGIGTALSPHTDHNAPIVAKKVYSLLGEGKSVAIVSDAGTPGLSDPGARLVSLLTEKDKDICIVPIPGPSALAAFLSVAGLNFSQFNFLGFLPHKKGRETAFKNMAMSDISSVFYESSHRIEKTLSSLATHLSEYHRILIGREMTKIHEEYIEGTAVYLLEYFKLHPDHLRGEFVVGVYNTE